MAFQSPASDSNGSLVLKTYPDGTKKIVPLGSLNFRDDGQAFGGPPRLSLVEGPAPSPTSLSPKSSERLAVAPIGSSTVPASLPVNLPAGRRGRPHGWRSPQPDGGRGLRRAD
jgi:hypothetical protein